MMLIDDDRPSVWKALREPEPNLVVRFAASLAGGMCFGALAAVVAFLFDRAASPYTPFGVVVCLLGWLFFVRWVWSAPRARRSVIRPIIGTLAVWACAIPLAVGIEEIVRRDEEALIAAVILMASAATVYVWASAFLGWHLRRAVHRTDGLVRVHCPGCGYSLIGLRTLRCPECGQEFALDEIIAAQRYDTSSWPTTPARRLEAESTAGSSQV